MSWLHRISVIATLGALMSSSGCCLFSTCAGGGIGCDGMGPGCGMETYYQGGCSAGGCDGCGDGPVIPCRAGAIPRDCGMGLGCIGKLLGMARPGCNGCGETYYHGWINDPPCCDPCDSCGNYTGGVGGGGFGCDSCGISGGVALDPGCGMAGPGCGVAGPGIGIMEPGCGIAEPGCGLATGCDSCSGGGCGPGGRTAFQVPGRAIYSTWTGMGGFLRDFRRGFLPSCRTCNAFSLSTNCNSCSAGPSCGAVGPACGCSGSNDVYFGGAGGGMGGCSSCAETAVVQQPSLAQHRVGRLPHQVVSNQMKSTHGRPPHQVVANRLRQRR